MLNTTLSDVSEVTIPSPYKHLAVKLGSKYKQLFVAGRIRAEILYRETIGSDPLTPEQISLEYGLPVEAVIEAIDYCTRNESLLNEERARESTRIKLAGRDQWPYAPRPAETER